MSFAISTALLNQSLAWSMGSGGRGRVKIEFPFNMAWYHEQPCKKFRVLQHRKEPQGLRHEFIILRMIDNSICRLERMGDPDARFDALSSQGSLAHDFAQVFPSQATDTGIEGSELVAEIVFPNPMELKYVLNICRAIHEGERTRSYTLQGYNCYFFALVLQCCLTRIVANWTGVRLFGGWIRNFEEVIGELPGNLLTTTTPSQSHDSNSTLVRIFSSASMNENCSLDVITKRVCRRLRWRDSIMKDLFIERLQHILDHELWYTGLEELPLFHIGQEVRLSLVDDLKDLRDAVTAGGS